MTSLQTMQDPEFEILAAHSKTIKSKHRKSGGLSWRGSPFDWIRRMPPGKKGKIGEELVSGYLVEKGFDVVRSTDVEADRIIAGKRAEIKMSTLWENGSYKFQQLRDQNYDFAICIGISPFDVHCWVLPKDLILDKWRNTGEISSQYREGQGSDTAWLSVNPDAIPDWLTQWGGTLSSAVRLIASLTNQKPVR